ncbi:MAG: right-handed parallel beta-helix repeat-containing protein [Spirochaetes bacterium]|nr:right-handed parallel beta-helix repeat-containing protein [Spirochaetota bacterium]
MRIVVFLGVVAVLLSSGACTNPMRATLEQAVKDYSTPKALLTFLGGSGIAKTTPIAIGFTETIDTASLRVGGSMAAESDGGVWSSKASTNDTLTIRPKGQWSLGSGKTLTVECSDLEGYPTPKIDVTYGVLDGIVYVRTNGSDSNPGTDDLPKKTFQEAIDTAAAVYASAEVHVAAGTYQPSDVIDLKDGISLYGGYSPDQWSDRETDTDWPLSGTGTSEYPTIIQTSSDFAAVRIANTSHPVTVDGFTVSGGVGGSGTTAIYCSNSTGVVLQSNVIDGGGGGLSIGIYIDSSPVTLQYNAISGGANGMSFAVVVNGSHPLIARNRIQGGTSGTGGSTVAIYDIGSSATIAANTIYGGDAWSSSLGIYMESGSTAVIYNNIIDGGTSAAGPGTTGVLVDGSSPILRNNTICGGHVSVGVDTDGEEGITNLNSAHATIENNIIFTLGPGLQRRYGITAMDNSAPASFKNNYVFDCASALFAWVGNPYVSVPDLNSLSQSGASGNAWDTSDALLGTMFFALSDPGRDWHLADAAPVEAREGGLVGSDRGWGFADDLAGTARTAPWSMGAYEKDP